MAKKQQNIYAMQSPRTERIHNVRLHSLWTIRSVRVSMLRIEISDRMYRVNRYTKITRLLFFFSRLVVIVGKYVGYTYNWSYGAGYFRCIYENTKNKYIFLFHFKYFSPNCELPHFLSMIPYRACALTLCTYTCDRVCLVCCHKHAYELDSATILDQHQELKLTTIRRQSYTTPKWKKAAKEKERKMNKNIEIRRKWKKQTTKCARDIHNTIHILTLNSWNFY